MPKVHVDKSIVIDKPASEIFEKLHNFHHWTAWSPWLITEPDAKVEIAKDGKYYEWEGKYVGAGHMAISGEKKNESIQIDLTFLKPWKSTSKVELRFVKQGARTRVHWIMDTHLPFYMFWMKRMMAVFIGMDFERGLAMMKEYMEAGKVHSNLEFKGIEQYNGCQYVGITTECKISELGDSMKEKFNRLMPYIIDNHKERVAGHAFSIYHKWQPLKDRVSYTAAVPVSSAPNNLWVDMSMGTVPKTKVHIVKHTGPYSFSGNAWSAQMSRQRAKAFSANRNFHPIEVYLNSPKDTPDRELQTEVLFGVKR